MANINPVAGQDYDVVLVEEGSLVDATVTIEYKDPSGKKTRDVTPTNVDTDTGEITYSIPNTDSTYGMWLFVAKIVASDAKIRYTNPAEQVFFDNKKT
jgi:hypothetical protein